MVTFHRRCYF